MVRLQTTTDQVGIGTKTPAGKLHVTGGDALFGGKVGIGTTAPSAELTVNGTIRSLSGGVQFPDGSTQLSAAEAVVWAASGGDIHNTNAGNVGIGTMAPAQRLEVNGGCD